MDYHISKRTKQPSNRKSPITIANLINSTFLQTIGKSVRNTLNASGRCFGGSYAQDYDSFELLSTEVRLFSSDEPASNRSLWVRTVERPIL